MIGLNQPQTIALCGMDKSLRTLVGLYCTEQPNKEQIANWFAGIELDALRPEVSCMAAAMAAASDYNGTPAELVPRLRGIIRYVHTLNSGMTAGLCILGKQLNEAKIPAVLLAHAAVHLGYPKPPCRHIWQMQLSVPKVDFPRAAPLAAQAGFAVEQTPYSATARCGSTQCVLIRNGVEFVQETTALTIGGVSFLMPSRGELIVDLVEAVFQLLFGAEPGAKLIPWLMDLHSVITADPDWISTASAAADRGCASHVRLVLELYHTLVPNALSEEILSLFGTDAQTVRLAQLLLEYRKRNSESSKWKRLWLLERLKNEGSIIAALIPFMKALWQRGVRKLTPGS